MINSVIIRKATLADAEAILKIYEYYVIYTAITYEYTVPTVEEFRARMENTMKKYPYLVVEKDGEILGYAYAGAFVGRAAYDWSVEMTVYLKHGLTKCGLGRRIYEALEGELRKMGILNLYACIGYPEVDDKYLTKNSANFHEHLGFKEVGRFQKCGYKFGRWYDMIWMEKIIGEHKEEQKTVIWYPKITEKRVIKEVTEKELSFCAELIQKSFLTVAQKFGITKENAPDFTAFAVTEKVLKLQLDDSNRKLYAYIEDEEIIGYYSLLFMENQECELNHLCVHPEYRHKKVGEKLLLDAFKNAKKGNAEKMCIGIVEENKILRKWYEEHGFVHTGTEKFDFFPFTCGYMEKIL